MRLVLLFLLVVGPVLFSVRAIARAERRMLPLLIVVETLFFVASLVVWNGLSSRLENRRIGRRRVLEFNEPTGEAASEEAREPGALGRWLSLAGYRSPRA